MQRARKQIEQRRHERTVWLASYHRRTERLRDRGLTRNGQTFQRRPSFSQKQRDWEKFRDGLDLKKPQLLFGLEREAA